MFLCIKILSTVREQHKLLIEQMDNPVHIKSVTGPLLDSITLLQSHTKASAIQIVCNYSEILKQIIRRNGHSNGIQPHGTGGIIDKLTLPAGITENEMPNSIADLLMKINANLKTFTSQTRRNTVSSLEPIGPYDEYDDKEQEETVDDHNDKELFPCSQHGNEQRQQLDRKRAVASSWFDIVFRVIPAVGSLPHEALRYEDVFCNKRFCPHCNFEQPDCLHCSEIVVDSTQGDSTKQITATPCGCFSRMNLKCLRNRVSISPSFSIIPCPGRCEHSLYYTLTQCHVQPSVKACFIDISVIVCNTEQQSPLLSWIFASLDITTIDVFVARDLALNTCLPVDKLNCSAARWVESGTKSEEAIQCTFSSNGEVHLNNCMPLESPVHEHQNSEITSDIILPNVEPEMFYHTMVTLPENKNKKNHRTSDAAPILDGHSDTSNDHVAVLRDLTWLSPDQLPVPDVELTVANVFESMDEIFQMLANGNMPGPQITMRYELLRLCTLRNYPKNDKPFIIRFAGAGFYYAANEDEVICFVCGLRKRNWNESDVPMTVHQRHSPNCRFLTHNAEVNVPVPSVNAPVPNANEPVRTETRSEGHANSSLCYPDTTDRNETAAMESQSWVHTEPLPPRSTSTRTEHASPIPRLGHRDNTPKFPQYATRTLRLNTYDGWPDNTPHRPEALADAGFYYAGIGDCVRCFHCGIGLRHWTEEDDVNIEHARWSRNCWYLMQTKGDEFIQLVHLAMELVQDEDEQPGASQGATGNIPPSEEIERILRSDAAQSVLEMGYQPKIIKKAIERVLLHTGANNIKAEMLMEKVLEIEEEEEALTNGVAGLRINTSNTAESAGADTQSGATGFTPCSTRLSSTPSSNTIVKTSFEASENRDQSGTCGRCVCKNPVIVTVAQSCAVEALRHRVPGEAGIESTQEQILQDAPLSAEEINGTDTVQQPETENSREERQHREADESELNEQPRAIDRREGKAKSLGRQYKNRETLVLKAENNRLKEQSVCRVCKNKHVCIVFLPCGHLVTCEDCAPAMRTCPVCKATVKGTVKTYAV